MQVEFKNAHELAFAIARHLAAMHYTCVGESKIVAAIEDAIANFAVQSKLE